VTNTGYLQLKTLRPGLEGTASASTKQNKKKQ